MTAGDLALVLAVVLCTIAFAALIVVLVRVLDALKVLRGEVATLRAETEPLIEDLRVSTDEAREVVDTARTDLERFDRVLGSAEVINEAMSGSGRVVRTAFSVPAIKIAGFATGTSRAMRRLRAKPDQRMIEASTSKRSIRRRMG